jgi:hypothetical protein
VFPQSISLAATWDKELLQDVGEVIGVEARGLRNGFEQGGPNGFLPNFSRTPPGLTCFSPQINIVRDPRWCVRSFVHPACTRRLHVEVRGVLVLPCLDGAGSTVGLCDCGTVSLRACVGVVWPHGAGGAPKRRTESHLR